MNPVASVGDMLAHPFVRYAFLAGSAVIELGERRGQQSAALASCVVVAAVSVAAAIAVAGSHGLTPNGVSFGG